MSRPREFDEPTALEAIRSAFWDHGYAATSVDELAKATGLGKASLYGAFGTKREMFVRALRQYCAAALALAEQRLAGADAGARTRLRAYMGGMIAMIASSRRGCLLAKAIAELSGEDGEVDEIVTDFYARYEEVLRRAIAAAQRAGEIPRNRSARRHAGLLVAVLRGLETMGKGGVPPATLRSIAESALP